MLRHGRGSGDRTTDQTIEEVEDPVTLHQPGPQGARTEVSHLVALQVRLCLIHHLRQALDAGSSCPGPGFRRLLNLLDHFCTPPVRQPQVARGRSPRGRHGLARAAPRRNRLVKRRSPIGLVRSFGLGCRPLLQNGLGRWLDDTEAAENSAQIGKGPSYVRDDQDAQQGTTGDARLVQGDQQVLARRVGQVVDPPAKTPGQLAPCDGGAPRGHFLQCTPKHVGGPCRCGLRYLGLAGRGLGE